MTDIGQPTFYKAGDVLYRQGGSSEGVYIILEGAVSISRQDGDQTQHIADLEAGQLIGEVSVIEKAPHSVSATVSADSKILVIPAEQFRRSFSDPLVRHVVQTLSSRLRSTVKQHALQPTKVGEAGAQGLSARTKLVTPIIEGESRMVAEVLLAPAPMQSFPFMVGRLIAGNNTTPQLSKTSLLLPIRGVPELADEHFEIIRRDGALAVRDLGSPYGTILNGTDLSRYEAQATARLNPGPNSVTAGKSDSPVRFTVTLPEEMA